MITVKQYLIEHGISDDSAKKFGLLAGHSYRYGDQLIIPVRDIHGNFLFNKYRNLGWTKDGELPKFVYDLGFPASLYNIQALIGNRIVLVEGEPDVIRLDQEGIPAVSSTSGAGTFEKNWVSDFVGKKIYICFDTDPAGKEGALKAANTLLIGEVKEVYIVNLPEDIKDICEYFGKGYKKEEFLSLLEKAHKVKLEDFPKAEKDSKSDKKEEISQTSFFITQEGYIGEEVYNSLLNKAQFAVFDGKSVTYCDSFKDESITIEPIQGEIVKKGVVKLPGEAEEYESELELFNKIKNFIHKYVDITEDWENWAAYYVLLSWVYDKLPVCPYLCALGPSDAGKTRFVQTIGSICYKPFTTSGSATASPIFRILDQFRGTLIVNEFDHIGDFNSEIIVIFNNGYEADLPVIRTEGDKKKEVKVFQVFGPKIFSARKRKNDWAFESRLLTAQMRQTKRKDIPTFLLKEFHQEAQEIRNMLLMFRFKHYHKEANFHDELFEGVQGRLRQTLLSITSVIDNPVFLAKVKQFASELKKDLTNIKGFDLDAVIYQILKDCWDKNEDRPAVKDITDEARRLSEIEKLTPKAVGGIIRDELGFKTDRGGSKGNYVVYLTKEQLDYLKDRYEDNYTDPKLSSDSSVSSGGDTNNTELTEDTELLKTPIDRLPDDEKLALGKKIFGEGTKWAEAVEAADE